jgi:hypothetical protein
MRARTVVGTLGTVAFGLMAAAAAGACFTQPSDDFDAFQRTIANLPKQSEGDAAAFDAAPPPAQAVSGLYYGACLSEFAFGQPSKVFNLYAQTSYTPGAAGANGTISASIHVLKVVSSAPPPTVSAAGQVGDEIKGTSPVDAEGRYTLTLNTVTFPGTGNPISGGDVVILNTTLGGRFSASTFCGRLNGQVTQPAAVARTLDPTKNTCLFVPIKDGDKTPIYSDATPFAASACPP